MYTHVTVTVGALQRPCAHMSLSPLGHCRDHVHTCHCHWWGIAETMCTHVTVTVRALQRDHVHTCHCHCWGIAETMCAHVTVTVGALQRPCAHMPLLCHCNCWGIAEIRKEKKEERMWEEHTSVHMHVIEREHCYGIAKKECVHICHWSLMALQRTHAYMSL